MRAACVAKVAALGAELEQSMLQLLDLRAAGGAELQEQWQQLSDKTAAAEARAKEMENELAVANDSVSELQTSLQQQILRQRALQQTLQLSDDEVDAWSQPAAKSASASSLNGMGVGALNMLNPLMGNLDANISLLSGGTAADKRFVAQDAGKDGNVVVQLSGSGSCCCCRGVLDCRHEGFTLCLFRQCLYVSVCSADARQHGNECLHVVRRS